MDIKTISVYFGVITTTVGITFSVAYYLVTREVIDNQQIKQLTHVENIMVKNSIKLDSISHKLKTIDTLSVEQKQLKQNLAKLAGSYERHIIATQVMNKDLMNELKQIYPLFNYRTDSLKKNLISQSGQRVSMTVPRLEKSKFLN